MRIARVKGRVFILSGGYIREYKTNRVYDPKTGEGFIGEGEKRLPLNAYGDFGTENDVVAVMEWKRDAATAYNILQTPGFMSIEVI